MPTGLVLSARPNATNVVDDVIKQARLAYDAGVRQVWLAQQFDHDAIALAGIVGAAVPGLGVGTSVVPINPRHPLIVASLAQTAQAASHGSFSLGLGLGAHALEAEAFGTSFPNTIQRLREHLTVLRAIFHDGAVSFQGEELTAKPGWPVTVAGTYGYLMVLLATAGKVPGPVVLGRPVPWLALHLLVLATVAAAVAVAATWRHRRALGTAERVRLALLTAGGALFVVWAAQWGLLLP